MKVRDLMVTNVVTVGPEAPVGAVARLLRDHDFSGVPVVDANNVVLGVVTEYDIITRHTRPHYPRYIQIMDARIYLENPRHYNEELRRVLAVTAEQLMTKLPARITPDDDMETAIGVMVDTRINPLPIVDENGRLAGILTLHDLLQIVVDEEA
ncbi:hypothetical protein ARMA_2263 [Ardenticatena maritima]|uniref:CBS domain-containing protein n=1 Tax=Ardenticatena maritima TaxID=872965 RepID=A0A0M9UDD3_9CHLR|nr:CBS domain-containing protein [Ardenticatena maritima]KPL89641.1 hypothetical protein SE16_04330 [Ardenticatena maritima]GAP63840.1 hypothetical protein ARMA_2263 [Ardenticatena maritima]